MTGLTVHVTLRNGAAVPGLETHVPGGTKTSWLLAAGLVQLRVTQSGAVPAVTPSGPHPAAVVKMVWLLTPGGFVHVVS
jgi:hypothetical protein